MKVQVKITRWPEKRRNPEGEVVEILGFPETGSRHAGNYKKYELPERFPPEVLREIKALNKISVGRTCRAGKTCAICRW